jgi:uncharacterized protein
MTGRMFQIFTKPVGATCNLSCGYCYYLEKQNLYPQTANFIMPDELLESYIIQHIEATTDDLVFFSWHGGEPMLAGPGFYRKAVEFQKKHLPSGKRLLNGIQTNGTLINPEWCDFFAKEGFIIGISIDGPSTLHNHFRKTKTGDDTFDKVLSGYRLLKQYGIITEILCVVNSQNVDHPIQVYTYFRSLGAEYLTFLPLVNRNGFSGTAVTPDSVSAEAWGSFLIRIFDAWQEKDIGKISIQLFDEAIRTAFNQKHSLCIFKERCGGVPVVEHNGDVYSCDHFVTLDHRIGNIREQPLFSMLDSQQQSAFGDNKYNTLPDYCINCPVLEHCHGECPKNRFISAPDGAPGLNYLCEGYKAFFLHISPFVEEVRRLSGHRHKPEA